MLSLTKLTALTLSFGLVACGAYAPLYSTSEVPIHIAEIQILNPEKNVGERRVAQIVRQDLLRQFPASADTTYSLSVNIEETESTLAVARDATAERLQLSLRGDIRLVAGDVTLLSTSLSSSAAYNVENTPFSTESGKTFAREAAARNLAERIALEIRLALQNTSIE